MVVNASARNYRVWICRDGEDETTGFEVTQFCSGKTEGYLTITVNPLSDSGLFSVTGQLVLAVPQSDERFDPWLTPDRWAIGNQVIFHCADQSGTVRPFPVNSLFITAEPLPPYPGNWYMTLDLGDRFVLRDSDRPKRSDISGTNRESALSQMLGQIDLELSGSLPGVAIGDWNFDTTKTIASQAGELALGGSSGLYQDRFGKVRAVRLNFTPEYRLFAHTVGVDCAADFQPIQNDYRPADTVTAKGDQILRADNPQHESGKYRGFYYSADVVAKTIVNPDDPSVTEIPAFARVTRWNWVNDHTYETSVEEQRVRGLTIPSDLYDYVETLGFLIFRPNPYNLINALVYSENKLYEGSSEGRLLTHETSSTKPVGEVLCEFYKRTLLPDQPLPNFSRMVECSKTVITYDYRSYDSGSPGKDSKGQIRQKKTKIYQLRGIIAANGNDWIQQGITAPTLKYDPTDLIPSEIRIETWRKRSSSEWEYNIDLYQAGKIRSGSVAAFSRLVRQIGKDAPETSRSGDIQPPAAERRPAKESLNRPSNALIQTVSKSVKFKNNSKRTRNLSIKNLESETAVQTIAEIAGKLDSYRHRGFRIYTALHDAYWYFKPFCRVDLIYQNRIFLGIVDTAVFTFSKNQALVCLDLMKVGQIGTTPIDSYPYLNFPPITPSDNPDPFGKLPIGGVLPDPDGSYLPSNLTPEIAFTQPLIPTVQMVSEVRGKSRSYGLYSVSPWDPTPQTVSLYLAKSSSHPVFSEPVTAKSRSYPIFTVPPYFEARSRSYMLVTEPEIGLFAHWEGNNIDFGNGFWLDSTIGSYNLTETGRGALLGYDNEIQKYYVEFGNQGDPEAWPPDSYEPLYDYYRIRYGTQLSTRTATGNWSWRMTFYFWFDGTTPYANRSLIRLVDEFEIYFDESALTVRVFNNQSVDVSAAISYFYLNSNTWYFVDVQYDAETLELKGALDGLFGPTVYTSQMIHDIPGEFSIGRDCPVVTRFRDVKYYKLKLVPRI